jgi:Zn ribbon nucleic-acid-binding protein
MGLVACPECGATRNLKGRREDGVIVVSCQSCGHEWMRDPERCPTCGGDRHPFRVPLLQKARGTQQSILAYRIEKRCLACDGPPPPVDGSATLDREAPGNA